MGKCDFNSLKLTHLYLFFNFNGIVGNKAASLAVV